MFESDNEYDTGYIHGAVPFSLGTIAEDIAAAVIPEKNSVVLCVAAVETAARLHLRLCWNKNIPMCKYSVELKHCHMKSFDRLILDFTIFIHY